MDSTKLDMYVSAVVCIRRADHSHAALKEETPLLVFMNSYCSLLVILGARVRLRVGLRCAWFLSTPLDVAGPPAARTVFDAARAEIGPFYVGWSLHVSHG